MKRDIQSQTGRFGCWFYEVGVAKVIINHKNNRICMYVTTYVNVPFLATKMITFANSHCPPRNRMQSNKLQIGADSMYTYNIMNK